VADVVRVLSHHDPNQVEGAAQMIKDQCCDFPAKCVVYAAARAIPSLVDALRAFPGHSGVQGKVCWALWFICFGNDHNEVCSSCQNIIHSSFDVMLALWVQIAIREAGGIDLILLASKNHIENVAVQHSVCGALFTLALVDSNKVLL
jgi:hypothetical protein